MAKTKVKTPTQPGRVSKTAETQNEEFKRLQSN